MQEVKWSEFKLMKATEMAECIKVMADGQLLGYFIVKPEGAMRDRIDFIAQTINASRK